MTDIGQQIECMRSSLEQELQQAATSREIDSLRIKYLGKKGAVAGLMAELKGCTVDERPRIGALINQFKELITQLIEVRGGVIATDELKKRLQEERLDVTLPGRGDFLGRRHVVMQVLDEAIDLLVGMGFSVQYGPEVETDFYNFEALNFSKNHPARRMHDTFYITSEWLLRTHTSNTQVRVMEGAVPPIRIIAPGKCYRNEDISARSHVLFHQIEGFYVDRDVTFADLLATLEELFTALLKREVKMRYRPSYFPFVEPGMEVDVSCIVCEGEGCPICKGSGWLEVAGAGMVHPEVLKFGGIDPEQFSGYAWGMGIERIAMLRFGIDDIRHFMENDLRFLQQF